MTRKPGLGKRARQVMEIIYQRGEISAAELLEALPELPSYSAARSALRNLEKKGYLVHETRDMQYIYRPSEPQEQVAQSALRKVVQTFFQGSPQLVMRSLLQMDEHGLSEKDRGEIEALLKVHKSQEEQRP